MGSAFDLSVEEYELVSPSEQAADLVEKAAPGSGFEMLVWGFPARINRDPDVRIALGSLGSVPVRLLHRILAGSPSRVVPA